MEIAFYNEQHADLVHGKYSSTAYYGWRLNEVMIRYGYRIINSRYDFPLSMLSVCLVMNVIKYNKLNWKYNLCGIETPKHG